jgi:hypothetical protein
VLACGWRFRTTNVVDGWNREVLLIDIAINSRPFAARVRTARARPRLAAAELQSDGSGQPIAQRRFQQSFVTDPVVEALMPFPVSLRDCATNRKIKSDSFG